MQSRRAQPIAALLMLAFLLAVPFGSALAQSSEPLPRFVSLRADEVNLRAGPGVRYPVEWVFIRRDWPVEVIAEFDNWRKIRDSRGTEGWVHSSMLSGRRAVVVLGATGDPAEVMRRTDQDDAAPVARLEPGVIAHLNRCPEGSDYCQVEVRNMKGWLKRANIWGVHRNEFFE